VFTSAANPLPLAPATELVPVLTVAELELA
jgi:hypothetical protein